MKVNKKLMGIIVFLVIIMVANFSSALDASDMENIRFETSDVEQHFCVTSSIRDLLSIIQIPVSILLIIIGIVKNKKGKKSMKYFIIAVVFFCVIGLFNIVTNFAVKPIIYIYPETETEVSVELGEHEKLSCSYPKYVDGWKVNAKPNGDLTDLKTGKNLYALYWEGKDYKVQNKNDGFVVKGEDSAQFLEEKLAILGLNERESEEFIVYWLPILEKNEYNFIRFAEKEEMDEYMPLDIAPKPETLIRVFMECKKVSKNYKFIEQKLQQQNRIGYTVVEWGGSQLK